LSGEILASLFGLCIAAKALLDPTARFYVGVIFGSFVALVVVIIRDRTPSLNDLLVKACEAENRGRIKLLQRLGADINEGYYDPPTHFVLDVALKKDKKFLDFLVQQGLQVPPNYLLGATCVNDMEFFKKYLEYGVDATKARRTRPPQAGDQSGDCMHNAVFFGNKEMIELLLEAGIDINDTSASCNIFPIAYAYRSIEGLRILDYLIEKGAGIVYLSDLSDTEFIEIMKNINRYDDAEKIIENITINLEFFRKNFLTDDIDKMLTDHYHYYMEHTYDAKCVNALVSSLLLCVKNEEKKYNLLQKWCSNKAVQYAYLYYGHENDNDELLALLLRKYSNFFNIECEKLCFFKCCCENKKKLATCLLQDDRIDVAMRSEALHKACEEKNIKIIKLLCKKGIDLGYVSLEGDSILHKAINQSEDILNLILYYGNPSESTLKHRNADNKTVFYLGCEKRRFKNAQDHFFRYCLDVKKFLHDELCNAATVLNTNGLDTVIGFCYEQGIDFNKRNKDGKRPLDIATKRYAQIASDGIWNSDYFINKERVMHVFMWSSDFIEDEELVHIFQHRFFPNDIIKTIVNFYHAVNADYLVAQKCNDLDNYYKKTKQEKQKFKHELVASADATLEALFIKTAQG